MVKDSVNVDIFPESHILGRNLQLHDIQCIVSHIDLRPFEQ